jgi:hypothetical protein
MVTVTEARPRVLILSFDPINIDPRVIKQVNAMVDEFDLVTASPGSTPHPDVTHIELSAESGRPGGRIRNLIDDVAREREWFGWSYRQIPLVRSARDRLRGERFDAVVANDAETVGVAVSLFGSDRVHADLHEFFPGLPVADDDLGARQRRYWRWLIKTHAARAASSTTVAPAIAERYRDFGLNPGVVTNASYYRKLSVRPTGDRIRVVHSGNPFRDRGLDRMMRAVASARADVTLDLYLTHNPADDRAEIVRLAQELGPRVTVHEPVSQAELVDVLSEYDLGIAVFPPTSENSRFALPNKFFDFIQARLGLLVGPSVGMEAIVRSRGIGVVTDDFEVEDIVRSLEGLDPETIDAFKARTQIAAEELSAETQLEVWLDAVRRLVSARPGPGVPHVARA